MSASGMAPLLEIELKSILVATDFSRASEKALNYAVSIARQYRSKVYLVNIASAFGLTMAGPEAIAQASELAAQEIELRRQRLLDDGKLEGITLETLVREGDIWHELENVIKHERIELIVIGTHSRTGLAKLALGSVAERIFRNAVCPVLTVGPNAPVNRREGSSGERRILFPTDLGEKSLRPLPYALSLARQQNARLVVLHVLAPVPRPGDSRFYGADDVIHLRKEARDACTNRLRTLIPGSFLQLEPIYLAKFGDPTEAILEVAQEHGAEIIVMGLTHTKHIDTLAHVPWSMTYKVVCGAQCPVLTVRG